MLRLKALKRLNQLKYSIKRPSELTSTDKNYNFEENPEYNQKIIEAKEQRDQIRKRVEIMKAESIKFLEVTDFNGKIYLKGYQSL